MSGKLYLIPVPLTDSAETIPSYVAQLIGPLRTFIVEDEKSARGALKKLLPDLILRECSFFVFNEHTKIEEAQKYLKDHQNEHLGLLSEAGVPCVADPGKDLVLCAHQWGMEVIPLIGPSSILLALMASGLNGQQFVFHGYLPKDKTDRRRVLKELEKATVKEGQTQIFMETPYRNDVLIRDVIETLNPPTYFSIAADLTSPTQWIKTDRIENWKKVNLPSFDKRPAIFLIGR
jgi:16S rRNA (cytidine1402-2'-O)-methyltransferase